MSGTRSFAVLLIFFLTFQCSKANIAPHALFSDHMVLQQNMILPVWGMADPGEKVIVNMGEHEAATITGADGKWMVRIGPLDPGGPFEMLIVGKDTVRIGNVLVGEVWVCSGQSNMAMEVRNCMNAEMEIASAAYPGIRHFQVKRTKASEALENLDTEIKGNASWLNTWEVCNPSTVGHFSASAYFFAIDLYKKMNIPVGIIHASWGGTTAEAWTPMDTLESDQDLRDILGDWPAYNEDEEWLAREYNEFLQETEKAKLNGKKEPLYFNQPSVLFNGIIAPLIPFGIRGVLWYQGESNAYRAFQYRDLFPALITQWRKKWAQGDFPFIFVQLANYHFEPQVFPELREAQSMALRLPQTAMAVTIDIGDSTDIHPANKQEAGRRLSLAAQGIAYGEDLDFSGPLFKKMFVEDSLCWLLFDHVGDGLMAKGGGALHGFTISGADGVFVEAKARIDGDQVIVWNENLDHPSAVRYAWANHPTGSNLFNKSGNLLNLPASPFRTDQWPGITSGRTFEAPKHPRASVQTDPTLPEDILIQAELESIALYSPTKELVNGVKWTFRKQFRGNPFLAEDYWPHATFIYRGKKYSGYQVNYDLYNNDFIVLYPDDDIRKYIELSKDYLESFSYTDTVSQREHTFAYFQIPGTKGEALYEKVYNGKTALFIRPLCTIGDDPSGSFGGVYNRSFAYYLQIEGEYKLFHSKKELFGALNRNGKELKKYIRKNRLRINALDPDHVVRVLSYFDEMENPEN